MGEVTTEQITTPITTDGEHDKFKHYVNAVELEKAYLEGIPCTALCGKKWLPQYDPDRYPLCPRCRELWEALEDA